jgi:serine/threonine-protein kinase
MIGARIGHIRITHVLGQGGMGDVYRGIDERLNRTVALKMIRADHSMSAEARGRFLAEARTLSSLDHPHICRIYEYIEAPEGDFLVLELVEGVTLGHAIIRGMSRAKKLRIAIEIADALAAAHRNGIVHRDLKPDNVMIAADGTAKVLDFGIARRNEDTELPAAPATTDDVAANAQTVVFSVAGRALTPPIDLLPRPVTERGIAVGTPGAMSPEQALGKRVGPESDMYSFGLLLHELFTEREPHPEYLSGAELMQRAAIGLSEPMTGQPRDITALVTRLKSFAPSDRPTAVETIAALQRIVDTPKRRARFAAVAVIAIVILAAAAKYIVDVTAARREAERRRGQAEELVSFIVGDLRTKLEGVGRLDVLDGAASRALAYFASLEPEELRGDDLHKNALALAQLGEVRLNEGKLDEAAKLFEQSIRYATTAVARDEKRAEWQLALSNAHFWMGDAMRRKGDTAATLQHFGTYLDISRRLAAAHPGNPKYEQEVSYGHGNVGAAYEGMGDLDRALAEYSLAVDIDRRRLQREPQNEQSQIDLATSLNRVGAVLQKKGDLRGAYTAFAEELPLRRRLVASSPNHARRLTSLASSLAYSGNLLQLMGETAQSRALAAEELALATRLAEFDPENLSRRRNLLVAKVRVAWMTPDPARALALIREAERGQRELLQAESRPAWQLDLAATRNHEVSLLLKLGDARAARAVARESLALLQSLAAADPRNRQIVRVYGDALLVAARAEEQSGAPDVARQYRSRAAALTPAHPPPS